MGDKVRLHQIILNLLEQCFKVYHKITVSVSLLSEDEEK
jgi:hypothetical protein